MQKEKQNRPTSWNGKPSNQKYRHTQNKNTTLATMCRTNSPFWFLFVRRALAERTRMKVVVPWPHNSRPEKCERTCFLLECTFYRVQSKGRSISPTETRQMRGHGISRHSVAGSVGIPAFRGFMSGIRRLVQDCVGEPMGQRERKPLLIDRQAMCSRACIRRGCTRLRKHRAKLTVRSLHTGRCWLMALIQTQTLVLSRAPAIPGASVRSVSRRTSFMIVPLRCST